MSLAHATVADPSHAAGPGLRVLASDRSPSDSSDSSDSPGASGTAVGTTGTSGTWENVRDFGAFYDRHIDFVWGTARRLGVTDEGLDDVVQEVFLVAHRRLTEPLPTDVLRSWLYGTVIRVVRAHRRTQRRKDPHYRSTASPLDPDELPDPRFSTPVASVEQADAIRLLHAALDELDDPKREIFVLAELEELTELEISVVLGENVNTVHSRLRAARRDFNRAVERFRLRDEWRLR
jgi:RNA polymerase sigma-70 factor, ECF subfamily